MKTAVSHPKYAKQYVAKIPTGIAAIQMHLQSGSPRACIFPQNVPDQARPASGRLIFSNGRFMVSGSIVCELPVIKGVVLGRAC